MKNKPTKAPIPSGDGAAVPKPRVAHTSEFKIAAVARMKDGKQTAEALALELGIRRNQLYKWAKTLEKNGSEGFKTRGRKAASEESEVVRLRRELARAQEELAILKKFDAYLKRLKL